MLIQLLEQYSPTPFRYVLLGISQHLLHLICGLPELRHHALELFFQLACQLLHHDHPNFRKGGVINP